MSFKIPAVSLFFQLLISNFMQDSRKNYRALSDIFKDKQTHERTHRQTRAITKDPLGLTQGPKMERLHGLVNQSSKNILQQSKSIKMYL